MISFIVPVYYDSADSYIVKRAEAIIEKFRNSNTFELIIVDSSRQPYLSSNSDHIKIIHADTIHSNYSPALARNSGVDFATRKYLFFFDVDLDYDHYFEANLVTAIQTYLESGKKNFLMIPCLYLSKKGTENFIGGELTNSLREGFLLGMNDLVLRLAINTSALIIDKHLFDEIGRFSSDFYGHGGEDFELIHRLAAHNPHAMRNDDYYTDKVEQFAADYVGFRRYMSYYAWPFFFKGLILVHKWHERPLTNKFYMKRKRNEAILQEKMKAYDELHKNIWLSNNPLQPMSQYLIEMLMKYNYDIETYCGLFTYKQGFTAPKNPIGTKIRKLLTRPKAFFLDSKIFKKARK